LTINKHITNNKLPPKRHNRDTNWKVFRNQLGEHLPANIPLKATEYVEKATEKFSNVIYNAAWRATPEGKPQIKYPEYPWEVKGQIKEKRKLRRKWRMSRHSEDKRR
jgi:hypothetical protein